MNDIKIVGIIGIITLFVFVGGILYFGNTTSSETPNALAKQDLLVKKSSIRLYKENKKVTLVEFGDFQCPACAYIHPQVKSILASYKDSVQFVFRHFPLPQHKNAIKGALASESANDQGKFWEMHDMLYENQKDWVDLSDPSNVFIEYAKKIGLDGDKFTKSLQEEQFKDKVSEDLADATTLQLQSTPSFFINGVLLRDNVSLQSEIEKALKK